MGKSNFNYIRLGLFVILAFVAFTYGVYRIGDRKDLFGDTLTIYTQFRDVKGLQAGNKVRFAGIDIGLVDEIKIVNDTTMRVQMTVTAATQSYLKQNALADIGSDGLVGNMLVNIMPTEGEAAFIQDQDFLAIKQKKELPEMLQTFAGTNETIEVITQQLLEITKKINEGQGSVAMLINDGRLAENLLSTTENLEKATLQINNSLAEVGKIVNEVSQGEGNLGYLLRDTSLKTEVQDLSANLDSIIALRTEPIIENLTTSSEAIAKASENIEGLFSLMENEDSPISALLGDSTLTRELRNSLENVEKGTEKFDENMEALKSNWFFRRHYKKKAKQAAREQKKKEQQH
jgi:phospholipid/cholesterol/gamma-HCH transport system substrate-binding protein